MKAQSEIIKVTGMPFVAGFNWSVGVLMEKFIKSLADKKLLAAGCPECEYIHLPPRTRCPKCSAKTSEGNLVEVKGSGTLLSYTLAYVELDGKGNFKDLEKPGIIAAVKLDEADSTVFMPLEDIEPDKLKQGLKVSLKWRDETKGEIADLRCFCPQ